MTNNDSFKRLEQNMQDVFSRARSRIARLMEIEHETTKTKEAERLIAQWAARAHTRRNK